MIFDIKKCRVYHDMKLILVGEREPTTGLWTLPISAHNKPQQKVDIYDLQMFSDAAKQQQFAANEYTRHNDYATERNQIFAPITL